MPPAEKRRRLSVSQQNGAHNLPGPSPLPSPPSAASSNPPSHPTLPNPAPPPTLSRTPSSAGAGRAALAASARYSSTHRAAQDEAPSPPPLSPLLAGGGGQFDVPPAASTAGLSSFSMASDTYGSSAGASGLGIEGVGVGGAAGRQQRPRIASRHSNESASSSAIPGPGDEIRLDGYRDGSFTFSLFFLHPPSGGAHLSSFLQSRFSRCTTTMSSPVELSVRLEEINGSR